MSCNICKGTKIIPSNGGWKECACVLRERIITVFRPLLPCAPINENINKLANDYINHRLIYIPKTKSLSYRTLIIQLLRKKIGVSSDYKLFKTYELIDYYLNKHDDDEEAVDMFNLPHKVLVLMYGFSTVPNKQELNITYQFLDSYIQSDKTIIFYNNTPEDEVKNNLINKGFYSAK